MELVYSTVRVPEPSAKQALPAAAAASGFRRPPAGPPRCSATERKQCPITHVQAAPSRRARSRSTAPAAASGAMIPSTLHASLPQAPHRFTVASLHRSIEGAAVNLALTAALQQQPDPVARELRVAQHCDPERSAFNDP